MQSRRAGLAIALIALVTAIVGVTASTSLANTPWNTWGTGTAGHCNIGTGSGYPVYGRYLNSDGVHQNRQCNDLSTAYHGIANSGANGFAVYRGTGSADQVCEAGRCGYVFYLSNDGWLPCAWFNYNTAC